MSHDHRHRHKRRRLTSDVACVDTSKPSVSFKSPSRKPREWTVSVAVPGSVLSTCYRDDQRTSVASHIARALAIFNIDEVVIFDDSPVDSRPAHIDDSAYAGALDPCGYLNHLLQYMEMPPFMRRTLLPMHPNLKAAGLATSLDIPSHPHRTDCLPYCEGITTSHRPKDGFGTLVDIGRKDLVAIAEGVPDKTRITLQIDEANPSRAKRVDPATPRTEKGYYWGFTTRQCNSLASVFQECTFEGGYDVSIGTSERGLPISKVFPEGKANPFNFKHLLVVFGGPHGLEYATANDPTLQGMGIAGERTQELFDHWVNILPGQGSRTIRTDEALFIGLSGLCRLWEMR